MLFAVAVVMAADGSNSSHLSRQSGVQRVQTLGAVEGAIVGAAADDSGALASGLGYALWYAVLPALRATQAATVQLSVPLITALFGVLLLGEPFDLRLLLASALLLGGVAWVLLGRTPAPR